jgi:hypothetical protein
MITKFGPQTWKNVHLTKETTIVDLILIENSPAEGKSSNPFRILRAAAADFETIIQEAYRSGQRVRALGSGWALTDIAITDGLLINTKALNGCFEVSGRFCHSSYEEIKRPYLIVAQCGVSIGELNVYLEAPGPRNLRRALKTSGIGAGQTVAGAISGNTHGSAVNFGSTPDWVVGLHLVTGNGKSWWIERASNSIFNDDFANSLGAELIRDDDIFNASVVSFGSFGVIAAVAIETAPIYQLKFQKVREVPYKNLYERLRELSKSNSTSPYHYEFIFNPYNEARFVLEASAEKVPLETGQSFPAQVWIARNEQGFTLGDKMAATFFHTPLLSSKQKASLEFEQYRQKAILTDIRGTPGQLFTATITYWEGYCESAIAVSIVDAATMLEVSCEVIRALNLPAISQVRLVHPSKALLGFTTHSPKTAVFEFGLANDSQFPLFERALTDELKARNVKYTFHWSKNSGVDLEAVVHMYGRDRIARWKRARDLLFRYNSRYKRVFDNSHLVRAGLA